MAPGRNPDVAEHATPETFFLCRPPFWSYGPKYAPVTVGQLRHLGAHFGQSTVAYLFGLRVSKNTPLFKSVLKKEKKSVKIVPILRVYLKQIWHQIQYFNDSHEIMQLTQNLQ